MINKKNSIKNLFLIASRLAIRYTIILIVSLFTVYGIKQYLITDLTILPGFFIFTLLFIAFELLISEDIHEDLKSL